MTGKHLSDATTIHKIYNIYHLSFIQHRHFFLLDTAAASEPYSNIIDGC
jgi:hypothetical protein